MSITAKRDLQVTEDHFSEAARQPAHEMQGATGTEGNPDHAKPEQAPETAGNDGTSR